MVLNVLLLAQVILIPLIRNASIVMLIAHTVMQMDVYSVLHNFTKVQDR